jgi:hypothetical protein
VRKRDGREEEAETSGRREKRRTKDTKKKGR